MAAKLRVLVIGAGTMGSVHSYAYRRLERAELVGIVDPFDLGPALAERLNVPHYAALEDVPSDRFDLVDVSVPSRWHYRYVMRAAELGKAVFCEKPLALDLAEARAMIAATAKAGVPFSVGLCVRFFPEYEAAKAIVDAGQLGEVAVVRTFRGGQFPTAWNDWYANRELSGGLLVDLMIHDFDFLRWVLGPVDRVYAHTTVAEMNRLDFGLATLRFRSGAIAHLEGTWAHRGFATRFEFAGSRGLLSHDSDLERSLNLSTRPTAEGGGGVAVPVSIDRASPYDLEIRHFVDHVLDGGPLKVTPEDAYEALRIALAARTSAATGQVIDLSKEEAPQ